MAVKCVNCGLLALRDAETENVCEVTESTRSSGTHKSSRGSTTDAKVFCFAKSPAFQAPPETTSRDMRSARGYLHPVVTIINDDRACNQFQEWIPGKSPKEHEDMPQVAETHRIAADAERRDIEFREATEQRIVKWRAEDKEWREGVEANIDRRHHANYFANFLLALLGAVIALIGSKLLPWQ